MLREKKSKPYHFSYISRGEISRIVIRSFVSFAIAYLFFAPFITNFQTTLKVSQGLTQGITECSLDRKYDAVAVFDGGSNQKEDGSFEPGTFTKRRLDAANLLIKNQVIADDDPLILLNGYQGKEGDPHTNNNYLRSNHPNLSNPIIPAPDSTSTSKGVDAAKQTIIDKNIQGQVIFVTDRVHSRRAGTILRIKGVNGCVATVESVNKKYAPKQMDKIKLQNKGKGTTWRHITEFIKMLSLLYDPQGNFTASLETNAARVFSK